MKRFKVIDALFQEGAALLSTQNLIGCCDKWLEAWCLIKELFEDGIVDSIDDLDSKYKWKHYPGNYVQYLEMELHNAGVEDEKYHQIRIKFCQELLQWCGADELLTCNTRIALAEAHYMSGNESDGEEIFKEWMREDPDCGWIYIGWADCYCFNSAQYEMAEEVLLAGYARSGLRDSKYVVESLINLYETMDKPDKVNEFKKIHAELQPSEPEVSDNQKSVPVRVEKIGRNAPCPCGSGKKYKRCCGA